MEQTTVNEFAQKHGYVKAEYLCNWRGFKCYEPIKCEGKVVFIGPPLLILEDEDGNIRMSTAEEGMQQIDEMG